VATTRFRVAAGDVFAIPVDEERAAIGVVVDKFAPGCFLGVFEGFEKRDGAAWETAIQRPIALQAITLDLLLRNGDWPVVGKAARPANGIEYPLFKSMTSPPSSWEVIDYRMARVRRASRADVRDLPHHTSVSPNRVESAVRALAGLEVWDDSMDVLLPPSRRTRPLPSPEELVRRALARGATLEVEKQDDEERPGLLDRLFGIFGRSRDIRQR
jgi:hypothetical protein